MTSGLHDCGWSGRGAVHGSARAAGCEDASRRRRQRATEKPAGNAIGVFLQPVGVTEKRLQLLKLAFPDTPAVTVFWDRTKRRSGQPRKAPQGRLGCAFPEPNFS